MVKKADKEKKLKIAGEEPTTEREAFEVLDSFYRGIHLDPTLDDEYEAAREMWETHCQELIEKRKDKEVITKTISEINDFFDAHWEYRELVKQWKVPAAFFMDFPEKPEKGFKTTGMQNDLREYLKRLRDKKVLDIYFPRIFKGYVTYQSHVSAKPIVLAVNSDMEVIEVAEGSFQEECLDFFHFLSKTRYQGCEMSLDVQIRLVQQVMLPMLQQLVPDDVESFKFENEPGFCWKKLDWTPEKESFFGLPEVTHRVTTTDYSNVKNEGFAQESSVSWATFKGLLQKHTPAWWDIISRMGNNEAYCAFLGALLTKGAKPHQFPYVHGGGGDGKGTMGDVLSQAFGERFCHTSPIPETEGGRRFFFSDLEGKRLLLMQDWGNRSIWLDETKMITGDKTLTAEAKGKQGRRIVNDTLLLTLSNFPPNTPRVAWAIRRMIYCPIAPRNKPEDNAYSDYLRAEMNLFFSLCILIFKSMPARSSIVVDETLTKKEFESSNYDVISKLEGNFWIYEGMDETFVDNHEGSKAALPHMTSEQFIRICEQVFPKKRPTEVFDILRGHFASGVYSRIFMDVGNTKKQVRCIIGVTPKRQMPDGSIVPVAWDKDFPLHKDFSATEADEKNVVPQEPKVGGKPHM